MALIIPPFYFNHCTDTLTGTPTEPYLGAVSFTAGVNNADSTPVTVLSALTHDCHYLIFAICATTAVSVDNKMLVDILIDPAGGTSWSQFISDVVVGGTSALVAGEISYSLYFHFPVFIKSGTSIGLQARWAAATGPAASRIIMYAFGDPSKPEQWWCGTGVESLGITASTSSGTDVTAGNAGAFGSWTDIGTSTAPYGAVQFNCNIPNNRNALYYHWQIGHNSAVLPGAHTIWKGISSSELCYQINMSRIIWCDIPSGTTMQIRGSCSGTSQTFDFGVYGVY